MSNAFVHTELSTADVARAKAFYKKLFDWKLEDMSMGGMTYTMLSSGGKTIGGIQPKMTAEQPTSWLPYVEVANVKKTIAKARDEGATIVVEFQPVGEMGAIGVFIDPTGAPLGIWAPARADEAPKKAKKKKADEKKAKKKKADAPDKAKKKKAHAPEEAKKADKKSSEKAKKADAPDEAKKAPKKAKKAHAPDKAKKKADKKR